MCWWQWYTLHKYLHPGKEFCRSGNVYVFFVFISNERKNRYKNPLFYHLQVHLENHTSCHCNCDLNNSSCKGAQVSQKKKTKLFRLTKFVNFKMENNWCKTSKNLVILSWGLKRKKFTGCFHKNCIPNFPNFPDFPNFSINEILVGIFHI